MANLGKVSRIAGEVSDQLLTLALWSASASQISLTHMKNDLEDLKLTD